MRDALLGCAGLSVCERLLVLHEIKRALCPCLEVCDESVSAILAAARAAGELP